MTNQERIKEYLVGYEKDSKHIDGYLEKDISNGKVIMLSGKWGSGKTHFWQNIIRPILNDEKDKKPNHYISLYGKTSIQEIKNEIFLKVFESVDSFKSEEKTQKVARSSLNLVSSLTKSISVFGMSLDLSEITDKSFEKLDTLLNDEKLKRTEGYLNSGAIICIDDFERKSKDIDLNDLFGFITQLTINFDCKVVIILNDDVFEGEEKNIFSNVKEKTVSKFLTYNPTIKELFNLVFDQHEVSKFKPAIKEYIREYIEETNILNARVYMQVLDNLLEWIKRFDDSNIDERRCLVLININFILYHTILIQKPIPKFPEESYITVLNFEDKFLIYQGAIKNIKNDNQKTFYSYIINLSSRIYSITNMKENQMDEYINFLNKNKRIYESIYFSNKLDISKNVDEKTFQKINNFIETGILINE